MFCVPDFVLSVDAYPGFRLGQGRIVRHRRFFLAESSDLSHMGVYMGMGVILVWALLRANTVLHVYMCACLVINYHRGDRSLIALKG